MDKLVAVNFKDNETLEKHKSEDYMIRNTLKVPKNILTYWSLTRKQAYNGMYVYKCNPASFKVTFKWLELKIITATPNETSIWKEVYEWFTKIMMEHPVNTVNIYYIGNQLSITRNYEYIINIGQTPPP